MFYLKNKMVVDQSPRFYLNKKDGSGFVSCKDWKHVEGKTSTLMGHDQ